MRVMMLAALCALTACGPSKDQSLATCKLSGERLRGEAELEIHLANCMTVAGYSFIEAKVGESARTPEERECFSDWDQAHFKAICYRP